MPYAYYTNLKSKDKAIYRRSDKIETIELSGASNFYPLIQQLETTLATENQKETELILKNLANGLLSNLELEPVTIKLLAARPSHDWGELHGLYEPSEGRRRAKITVWMRTAHHKRVVAFRTFLRTLLHEICHHLDYKFLCLEDSFHTEGFFKRESSLFKQLVSEKPK
jgi:hypothetical protein